MNNTAKPATTRSKAAPSKSRKSVGAKKDEALKKGHFKPEWHTVATPEALLMSHMAFATDETKLEGYLRASALVPDGSPLNDLMDAFYKHTPIPLELPLFTFLFYLSAWLVQEDVGVLLGGKKVPPVLWVVLLARSGALKTFSQDVIKLNAPVQSENLDGFESDAKCRFDGGKPTG